MLDALVNEEVLVSTEEVPSRPNASILIVIGTFCFISIIVFCLSAYSNHYGYFGDKGQFYLGNDRIAKQQFLQEYYKKDKFSCFILGSSDMLPFQPKTVEKYTKLKTFNLANYWGRMEEIWAWTNYLIYDLKKPPKLLVVGLEPWTFSASDLGPPFLNQYRRRLLTTPDLVKYLPNYNSVKRIFSIVLDSISLQNMKVLMLVSKRDRLKRLSRKPMEFEHELDGTAKGYNKKVKTSFLPEKVNEVYSRRINSTVRVNDEVKRKEFISSQYIRLNHVFDRLPYDRMDEEDLLLFKKFMALCDQYNIEVVVVLPPVHPYFRDMMLSHTKYLQHLDRIKTMLSELKSAHKNFVFYYDATNLKSFGGDVFQFHDPNHMSPINTNKILDQMFSFNNLN